LAPASNDFTPVADCFVSAADFWTVWASATNGAASAATAQPAASNRRFACIILFIPRSYSRTQPRHAAHPHADAAFFVGQAHRGGKSGAVPGSTCPQIATLARAVAHREIAKGERAHLSAYVDSPSIRSAMTSWQPPNPESATFSQNAYSTVTDLARLRGWSTSVPITTAV
jgi:hypothetical protein